MPRPVSWLPRLHEISRAASNSVRSHYDRRDLEHLFELQPRAAQKLIELLPSVQIGTSRLVEREVMITFLDRVQEAEDVGQLFEEIRSEKAVTSRRKVRSLVRRDLEPVSLTSLPDEIRLSRGQLVISFRSVEELAEAMLALARVLESEGDEFARAFEPLPEAAHTEGQGDVREMFAELERTEAGL